MRTIRKTITISKLEVSMNDVDIGIFSNLVF
jgi:hypothetical protein